MKNLLEKYRLKITPGRLAILEYMTKHRQPVSADTISKKLHQSYDLATIYRSLEIFAAKKIIFFEVINNVKNYYFAPKPHHHIICRPGFVSWYFTDHQKNRRTKKFPVADQFSCRFAFGRGFFGFIA